MLSDVKIRNLQARERGYKIADRDGMYVYVLPSGTKSFRFSYRINGRQETVVLGQYGEGGLSLKEAREKLDKARKSLVGGLSPARQKVRERSKAAGARTFAQWAELWLKGHKMADSTRDMRRSVLERDLLAPYGCPLLAEFDR